jgi:two-component system chemotaxis sensor kinase CheA
MNVDLGAALQTYLAESRELLEDMERALLEMETEGPDSERINAVFRAIHTIKGSGGLFGLDALVEFSHAAETVLDNVRSGNRPMDPPLIGVFLQCRDHIAALVEASVEGSVTTELQARSQVLRAQLMTETESAAAPQASGTEDTWHISWRCGPDLLRDGMDPLGLLRYLGTLGELVRVTTIADKLPPLADMDPKTCYLGFEIDLRTDVDKAEIDDAFEFVRSSSLIRLLPPKSKPEEWAALINDMPEDGHRLGDILVQSGALTRHELSAALGMQGAETAAKPLGQILVEMGAAPQTVVTAALDKQAKSEKAKGDRYVRVEAEKLDRLVNLVGELVISNTVTALRSRHSGDEALLEAVKTSGRFIEEVRDAALGLRMVQIGGTFSRFQRVVRDLAHEMDKKIDLAISGAETELDKTVVDRIGDPLTHLVRNSIDHGIEPAAERLVAGKPEHGTVGLNAYHESGSIVIEVTDDGRGLNREKILAKAVERGLVSNPESLSDNEIYKLIFEPGFSTASQVTNISGRGVGMDVVKRTLDDLRGTVEVQSRPGQGATISLRLPLTLAIIDGFLVAAGQSRFIIPLELVEECIELPELGHRDYVDLRGEVLPFLRLRDLFGAFDEQSADRQIVVVVGYAGKKAGLVVDRLLGELQTVIKPLGDVFAPLKWVSGCTVLDIGEVGLILDVPALVAKAERKEQRHAAHAA